MQFSWIDYPGQYEAELEHWCDETARRYALSYKSIKKEHEWYANASEHILNQASIYSTKIIFAKSF